RSVEAPALRDQLRLVPAHPGRGHGSGRRVWRRRSGHGRRTGVPRSAGTAHSRVRSGGGQGGALDVTGERLLPMVAAGDPAFDPTLARLERRGDTDLERVELAVREVVRAVRQEGDRALERYVEQFEKRKLETPLLTDYGGEAGLGGPSAEARTGEGRVGGECR